MAFNVVSKTRLTDFGLLHPKARAPLNTWHHVVSHAAWTKFADVKQTYRSADMVNDSIVFDVGGGFRVVAKVFYQWKHVFIQHVFTHPDYEIWSKEQRKNP